MTEPKTLLYVTQRDHPALFALLSQMATPNPVLYVTPQGEASFCLPRRAPPRSRLGVAGAMVGGWPIDGWLPLEHEPFLRALLWRARLHEPQITQVAA